MGMAAILFNDAEPFEQSVNIPSTVGPVWNNGENWSSGFREDFMVLYLYTAKEQGQITPRGQSREARADNPQWAKFWSLLKRFTTFIIHCKFQPLVLNTYWKKKMVFQLFPHTNL